MILIVLWSSNQAIKNFDAKFLKLLVLIDLFIKKHRNVICTKRSFVEKKL